MVADWLAAARAYNTSTTNDWPDTFDWPWYKQNYDIIKLHPSTRELVDMIIMEWRLKERVKQIRDAFR
jgi:hypothetical protein